MLQARSPFRACAKNRAISPPPPSLNHSVLVDEEDGFALHDTLAQRRECSQRIAPPGF